MFTGLLLVLDAFGVGIVLPHQFGVPLDRSMSQTESLCLLLQVLSLLVGALLLLLGPVLMLWYRGRAPSWLGVVFGLFLGAYAWGFVFVLGISALSPPRPTYSAAVAPAHRSIAVEAGPITLFALAAGSLVVGAASAWLCGRLWARSARTTDSPWE